MKQSFISKQLFTDVLMLPEDVLMLPEDVLMSLQLNSKIVKKKIKELLIILLFIFSVF
jgi:hypothetical protein